MCLGSLYYHRQQFTRSSSGTDNLLRTCSVVWLGHLLLTKCANYVLKSIWNVDISFECVFHRTSRFVDFSLNQIWMYFIYMHICIMHFMHICMYLYIYILRRKHSEIYSVYFTKVRKCIGCTPKRRWCWWPSLLLVNGCDQARPKGSEIQCCERDEKIKASDHDDHF